MIRRRTNAEDSARPGRESPLAGEPACGKKVLPRDDRQPIRSAFVSMRAYSRAQAVDL